MDTITDRPTQHHWLVTGMLRFGQIDATDLAQSTVTGSAEPDYIFINPPFGKGQKEQKHETQDRT